MWQDQTILEVVTCGMVYILQASSSMHTFGWPTEEVWAVLLQVRHGLLFVWGQSGAMAELESQSRPVPIGDIPGSVPEGKPGPPFSPTLIALASGGHWPLFRGSLQRPAVQMLPQ